jgi:hypothetical protein
MHVAILLAGAIATDNIAVRIPTSETESVFGAIVYIGQDLHRATAYMDASSDDCVLPKALLDRVEEGDIIQEYIYMHRMESPQRVDNIAVEGTVPLIGLGCLSDVSVVVQMYKSDFVFLGPPANEIRPHVSELQCGDVTLGPGIDMNVMIGTTPVRIVWSRTGHSVADPDVCGHSVLDPGGASYALNIDCSSANTTTGTTTISALDLELSVSVHRTSPTTARACFFRAYNHEVDHTSATITIAVLTTFLPAWIYQTKGLLQSLDNPAEIDRMWRRVAVDYAPVNLDLVVLTLSLNMYASLQGSNSMLSFSALRVVTEDTVRTTMWVFSYVITPIIGVINLLLLTAGYVLHGPPTVTSAPFSWGLVWISRQPLLFRLWIFTCATAMACGGIYAIWGLVLGDFTGVYMMCASAIVSLLHLSSPHLLTSVLNTYNELISPVLPIAIVWLRWAVEFLIITCIQNNLPLDVAGTLSVRFHAGISISLGCILLYITGRDFTVVKVQIENLRTSKKDILDVPGEMFTVTRMVYIAISIGMHGFVVWYVSIFSMSGLFANTDALQNKPKLAHLCAITASAIILAASSIAHGNARPHSKLP